MHPLTQKIASIQRRLVWRRRAVAACWILATGLTAALLLGLGDYLLRYADSGLRIMATTALLAAIAWAAYRWWYLPRQQQLLPIVVARRVETHFPQLQDSLASAIEFLGQSEHDQSAGSAQLRRLVIADAQNKIESLPLNEVIERGPLRKAGMSLGIAAVAVAICLMVDAGAVRTAIARLVAPLGSTQWPRQHHLTFRKIPTQLAAGQTFEVELVDAGGALPDDVKIEYGVAHNGGREITSEPMKRAGDEMVARRENVRQSFAFRATGGDDDTMPWNWVEVKEPPGLASLTVLVHPPAYSGIPASKAERHLEVLAGTGIEVSGTAREPIRAARIVHDRSEPIEAIVSAETAGAERRAFHIGPEQWIAAESGSYQLELMNDSGLTGVVAQWDLRVETDSPPSVTWQLPSDDLYVLPRAIVPFEILVKDDLAIQRVELTYDCNDKSESERAARMKEPAIAVYRGPEKPPTRDAGAPGDSRVIKYSWDLAPLQLPVGAVLTVAAEASDYRPGVGRTVGPRRISIINVDELQTRLADRQSQIVRQLERALTIEGKTREDVHRIEIQLRDAGGLTKLDRATIQTAEPNQSTVLRMLVDPAESVLPLIDAILNEIEINRLENSETGASMNRLAAELKRLSAEPLSVAERELTALRKAVEAMTFRPDGADGAVVAIEVPQAAALSRSIAAVLKGQDDIVATLERLISELSRKFDSRRFIRLIAELREDQLLHEKSVGAEIGIATLPLETNELSRAQRANLNKAVAGETAIAGRLEKIEEDMAQLARKLTDEKDPAAGALSDAVDLTHRLAIGTAMQQTATDLSENRVGQARAREIRIADELQQLLNLLRNEGERRPQQLVDNLREAEKRLAELRRQLAGLRQQIAQAEQKPNLINPDQLRQLHEQQQNMRRDIDQLARELGRLQAADASKATQTAANQLNNGSQNPKPGEAEDQRPSPSNQVKKAENTLEQAARQLAERRQQAEDDLALVFVRRFQTDLSELVKQQQKVLKNTAELDLARKATAQLTGHQTSAIARLAGQERQLANTAKEHSELLSGLGAVRVSLEDAEQRLLAAGRLLDERQTGPSIQTAEQLALSRLQAMMQAFAQTANEAGQKPNANNAPPPLANNDRPPPKPQRRPTFELLEVKMLRMLQADLNERTRAHEQRLGAAAQDRAAKAAVAREGAELAVEQGRLAELVEKMLTRDNEKRER